MAQTFAGAKTFLAAAIFSAGVQLSLLFGTNGSGASDVVIKAGTTLADASTNAAAKLLSVRTGLGATEVEHFAVTRNGVYFQGYPAAAISCSGSWLDLGALPVRSVNYFFSTTTYGQTAFYSTGGAFASNNRVNIWSENAAGAGDVAVRVGPTQNDATINAACILFQAGTALAGTFVEKFAVEKRGVYVNDILEVGGGSGTRYMGASVALTINTVSKTWMFNMYSAGSNIMALTRLGRFSLNRNSGFGDAQGASASFRTAPGTNETTLRVEGLNGQSASLTVWQKNTDTTPVTVREVTPEGQTYIKGVVSGTIGNDTKNAAAGTNTLASGATSVTITNSLVTTTTPVSIDFHADPGGRHWVTRAAGSFTVNVSAAPGANAPFSWEVKGLL